MPICSYPGRRVIRNNSRKPARFRYADRHYYRCHPSGPWVTIILRSCVHPANTGSGMYLEGTADARRAAGAVSPV